MKVSEVMSTEFETIEKDQTLQNALNLMRKKKDTSRLIVIQGEKPVGIISFRDVANRLGTYKTDGISPKSLRVSSAMTYPILTIDKNAEVETAANMMFENRVSSLLVMEDEKLIGVMRKYDLLKVYDSCKKIKVKELMTENPVMISESERVISTISAVEAPTFRIEAYIALYILFVWSSVCGV